MTINQNEQNVKLTIYGKEVSYIKDGKSLKFTAYKAYREHADGKYKPFAVLKFSRDLNIAAPGTGWYDVFLNINDFNTYSGGTYTGKDGEEREGLFEIFVKHADAIEPNEEVPAKINAEKLARFKELLLGNGSK